MRKIEKKELINKHSPRSKIIKDCAFAFIFGGVICVIAELITTCLSSLIDDKNILSSTVTVIMIFIAALLTAIGVFDKIAKYAGAGTLVPVTGFSNAVVSQAMDAKSEGYILGVGAKIFTVAGPVILYGIASGTLYGLIYYLSKLLGGMT